MCSLDQALDLVESLRQSDFAPLIDHYQEIDLSALLIPLVQQTSGTQLDLAIGLSGFEHDIVRENRNNPDKANSRWSRRSRN